MSPCVRQVCERGGRPAGVLAVKVCACQPASLCVGFLVRLQLGCVGGCLRRNIEY